MLQVQIAVQSQRPGEAINICKLLNEFQELPQHSQRAVENFEVQDPLRGLNATLGSQGFPPSAAISYRDPVSPTEDEMAEMLSAKTVKSQRGRPVGNFLSQL